MLKLTQPAVLAHERLSIVGVGKTSKQARGIVWRHKADFSESGAQPLTTEDGSVALAVNGEIYNHRVLRKHLKQQYPFKTTSDCEVIIPLVRPLAL